MTLRWFLAIGTMLSYFTVFGQDGALLDAYIQEALKSNLALQQQRSSYQKSILALQEAKGLYLPNISLNARASASFGGREIVLPVGDMLNPIYSTLNQLTQSYAQSNPSMVFPDTSIQDATINFLRPFEHETKLRLVQPIYNPVLRHNRDIKQSLVLVEEASLSKVKQQLVAHVKTAYYIYLSAKEVVGLLEGTQVLLQENVRVNQSLFDNGKVTVDKVYRSEAELAKLEQQQAEATKQFNVARAYFNFLLNRDLLTEIISDSDGAAGILTMQLDYYQAMALENRPELEMAEHYQMVAQGKVQVERANLKPSIAAVVDYGFQGATYQFNSDYDYMLASLVFKWTLFSGKSNDAKVKQAMIYKKMMANKQAELVQQVSLQVMNAYYDVDAAFKSISASAKASVSAEKAFKVVDKKYRVGQANLIEFMDSRNNMTVAKQQLIVARFTYLSKLAEFERITAAYPVNEINH